MTKRLFLAVMRRALFSTFFAILAMAFTVSCSGDDSSSPDPVSSSSATQQFFFCAYSANKKCVPEPGVVACPAGSTPVENCPAGYEIGSVPGSSSSGSSSSGSVDSGDVYDFCVYFSESKCTSGNYASCLEGGIPSNSCPFAFSVQEYAFCVYNDREICLDGPVTTCPGSGALSDECPFEEEEPPVTGGPEYCVYRDANLCLHHGPIAECPAGGELIDECPDFPPPIGINCWFDDLKLCLEGLVSECPAGGQAVDECPNSSDYTYDFCVFNESQFCQPGPVKKCHESGVLSNTCPFIKDDYTGNDCTDDYNNYASFRDRAYYCSYEEDITGTTGKLKKYGVVTDARNNKAYKTVKIGEQVWMAENLNFVAMVNVMVGDEIAGEKISGNNRCANAPNTEDGMKIVDSDDCKKYGRYYTWPAVMGFKETCVSNLTTTANCNETIKSPHRGICPEGWHVPSQAEYNTLVTTAGGATTTGAGTNLRAREGWSSSPGVDKLGFSILDGFIHATTNAFTLAVAYMRTTTENTATTNFPLVIAPTIISTTTSTNKNLPSSLRCIKD
jgi:uncharacterized protein (TIGR02145 family)